MVAMDPSNGRGGSPCRPHGNGRGERGDRGEWEKKLRGATKDVANAPSRAPQVSLTNTGEQVLDRPLRGLGGGAGGRGLPPLPLGWGRGGRSTWRNVSGAFVAPRSLLSV